MTMKQCIECIRTSIVCAGIILCPLVVVAILIFFLAGVLILALAGYCGGLFYGTVEPTVLNLPDLHNPGDLEDTIKIDLLRGSYELSSEYNLQLTESVPQIVQMCILKRHFSTASASACLEIGTKRSIFICGPDMRPDCLPSSIFQHYFGVSLWFQPELFNESKVVYSMVDIDSGKRYARGLTNTTTTLSAVWYDVLGCQNYINLTIAVIIMGIVLFICCLGGPFCCYWICCRRCKPKR